MRRGGEHGVHIVLVAQRRCAHTLAAALLRGVLVDGHTFDVAAVREREHALLFLDEVLDINVVLDVLDFRLALVAVLVADGDQLVAQHGLDLFGIGQQLAEVGDALFQLVILVLQLLALEPLQGLEAHIENGLRLHVGQAEALHEVFLRIVIALADDADDLVDVLLGDEQTLEQMRALERFLEVELRAAHDDLFLEGEVLVENVPQGQDLRLRLVIDQREHVHGERGLHLRLGEEPVEHDLGVGVLFQLDDDAHAVAVGLVAQAGDAVELLIAHLLGNILDELALVDLIGQLGHDDADAVVAPGLGLGAGAHDDAAAAGGVGRADAAAADDDAPRREIRARDVLHEVRERGVRVFEHADAGIDDLGEVVRRDIRRHADGDAGAAVDEQVRKPARQHARLAARLVKVRVPVHGVLVDVAQHFVGDLRQTRLGVSVGGRGVAVHGAEVAVAVDEHVAHGKVLRQTHHRVVHGRVAVGMVPAEHVADAGGGFFERLIRGQIVLIHGVEDAAVHGLETVAHIRQRTPDDDGHGILDVRGLHLMDELALNDLLVGIENVLPFIILGHGCTPP